MPNQIRWIVIMLWRASLYDAALPMAGAGRRVASVQPAGLELAASLRRYSWLLFCQSRLIFQA